MIYFIFYKNFQTKNFSEGSFQAAVEREQLWVNMSNFTPNKKRKLECSEGSTPNSKPTQIVTEVEFDNEFEILTRIDKM